ncbi:hypothetical protein AAE478_003526 [Parahypoxylon ruwenzoriense]
MICARRERASALKALLSAAIGEIPVILGHSSGPRGGPLPNARDLDDYRVSGAARDVQ